MIDYARGAPRTMRLKFGDMAGAQEFVSKQRFSVRIEECRRCLVDVAGPLGDAALFAKHLAGYNYNR